jgi:hypothetical protein
MPHRNVGHFFYNIFPSCLNCSSSGAETRILCVYVPLGSARGTNLGFARGTNLGFARGADLGSARGALVFANCSSSEAETRILCVYVPLGSARGTNLGFARGATLGSARGATLGFARGTTLGFARGTTLGSARGALGFARGANTIATLEILYQYF